MQTFKINIMENKETLQKEIYTPAKELKDKFYNAKNRDEWNACKEELKPLLAKIGEPLMTAEFAENYKKNLIASIAKIAQYKEAYFEKQANKKQYQPKVTYLLQPELAQALTEYIKMKTLQLQMQMEYQKNALDARDYC